MTSRVLPAGEAAVEPPRTGRRPVQRHPVDLVRVVLGLAVLGLGLLVAQRGRLPVFEQNLFQIVNDLPPEAFPVVWAVMQLGNVAAVPVVAAVAALTGRVRMARDMLVSGVLAYLAADLVKSVVQRERPGGFPLDAHFPEGPVEGLGFVSGHSAVAAALATAVVPYLSRRARRTAWALAWAVALARVYVGAHLPLDIAGGLGVGWAIGSLVHWAFGVPRLEVPPDRVARWLAHYGLPARDVRPAAVQARSSIPFEAVDEQGRRLYVKWLEPDRRERDWLYRLWRLLAVRDVKDADAVAPLGQQAEHEAVTAMIARERGVHVPRVLLARGKDRGAIVVQEYVVGRGLDELPVEELTPELLTEVWRQVALLRGARVAHHDLVAASLLVDPDGRPWVVDFGNALTGASDDAMDADVAELLASLALRTDPGPVVDGAITALGPDVVAAALPQLTPMSLTSVTRSALRADRARLEALRRVIRGRLGLPDPDRPEFGPPGLAARLAVAAGAGLVLVGVPLLAGATEFFDVVEDGGWRWLGAAVALAVLARAANAAAALMTVERRLALGRTYAASLVAESASLLHGGEGWRRSAARFLERAGVLPEDARRSIGRYRVGAVVAAVVVAGGMLVMAAVEGRLGDWDAPEALVPAVALGLGAWALVLTGQWLAGRHDTAPGSRRPPSLLSTLARVPAGDPWRWGAQFCWSTAGVVLEAGALAAAMHAAGGSVRLLATATVYAALHLLWSVLPATGAPGAAEVSLLLALTALGAPLASACAAALVFRVLTWWLPALLGWLLTARLEHRFGA
ncbi:phosphatase PAP2 family protein [Geodermatophilus sabuli]|uniref:Undecaprenyl-diphosphatase n=1 Tax=Geodermatophilus sabuli TaxID=1564158 RepID=A0A285ELJ7_9ACTN|nr:phosphatase PAP2 family protein [Geodermatophilus sabuli]MBB3083624.1 undecaprenyl-diphosphatase [Geodermatophilus sabuli]SNX99054.1 undecaprenyl-diphosphatase [Geodermatophilus sabuli]